jgi:hypothetical protein
VNPEFISFHNFQISRIHDPRSQNQRASRLASSLFVVQDLALLASPDTQLDHLDNLTSLFGLDLESVSVIVTDGFVKRLVQGLVRSSRGWVAVHTARRQRRLSEVDSSTKCHCMLTWYSSKIHRPERFPRLLPRLRLPYPILPCQQERHPLPCPGSN